MSLGPGTISWEKGLVHFERFLGLWTLSYDILGNSHVKIKCCLVMFAV